MMYSGRHSHKNHVNSAKFLPSSGQSLLDAIIKNCVLKKKSFIGSVLHSYIQTS